MKLLGRIFDFYLDASIHVALAVFCLLYVTTYFLNISIDEHLGYFTFFSTIACYNFVKYGVEAEKYILVANRYHKNIQFVSFIALGVALYHSYFFPLDMWIAFAILMGLTGLYALPVLPKAKNLRSFGGLKIFPVALVWTGTTVVLPLIAVDATISWDIWVESIQRFLLVLVLIMPFEIRDLKYDTFELNTLPQRYGAKKTKMFGGFLAIAFFFLTFLKDDLTQLEILGKTMLFFALIMVMFFTKKEQSKYFSSFWVEAIPIFWWGSLWVLRQFL
ncbi:MAG: hypothetical protein WBG90_07055 [Saonia sp.]